MVRCLQEISSGATLELPKRESNSNFILRYLVLNKDRKMKLAISLKTTDLFVHVNICKMENMELVQRNSPLNWGVLYMYM